MLQFSCLCFVLSRKIFMFTLVSACSNILRRRQLDWEVTVSSSQVIEVNILYTPHIASGEYMRLFLDPTGQMVMCVVGGTGPFAGNYAFEKGNMEPIDAFMRNWARTTTPLPVTEDCLR